MADPLLFPQLALVIKMAGTEIAAGSVIVICAIAWQLFASATVQVYVPAIRLMSVAPFVPSLQLYTYPAAGVPPPAVAMADPVLPPLQSTLVPTMPLVKSVGSVI